PRWAGAGVRAVLLHDARPIVVCMSKGFSVPPPPPPPPPPMIAPPPPPPVSQADSSRRPSSSTGRNVCLVKFIVVFRLDVREVPVDRKSTRLNSSHVKISYAVF